MAEAPLQAPSQPAFEAEPSTSYEDECASGATWTRRGFRCPPSLVIAGVGPASATPTYHEPGVYRSTMFEPAFSFVRSERFQSFGETLHWADLDASGLTMIGPTAADRIAQLPDLVPRNKPDGWLWVDTPRFISTVVDGQEVSGVGFRASCANPDDPPGFCEFEVEGVFLNRWTAVDGDQVMILSTDIDGLPVVFQVIVSDHEDVESLWTSFFEPIVQSVEFVR